MNEEVLMIHENEYCDGMDEIKEWRSVKSTRMIWLNR
jgi:hypothetical protein